MKGWLLLILLACVWGSSFILIKKSLIYFTGAEVGILRIAVTFLFLLPFAITRLKKINRQSNKNKELFKEEDKYNLRQK